MKFRGRYVLITGSSRGIGAAMARGFAAEGASVAINFHSSYEAAEQVAAECNELGGDAITVQADVTDPPQVQQLFQTLEEEWGRVDVLVNNALPHYEFDPIQRKLAWEIEWASYQSQIDGALKSAYLTTQAVLPMMKRQARGSIINMVTDLLVKPFVPYHDYNTAKSAVLGYSKNLAVDVGPLGIRVNCVAPGLVYPTDASRRTNEATKTSIILQTPMGRFATPEDVVGPVLFLASDWSQFMTGQCLYVDGGLMMP